MLTSSPRKLAFACGNSVVTDRKSRSVGKASNSSVAIFAPNVVTLLYQFNSAPWEPQLRFDPDGDGTTYTAPDDRSTDVIANEIVDATYEASEEDEEHPPEISDTFLDAIEPFPLASGSREKAWEASPVGSSQFL